MSNYHYYPGIADNEFIRGDIPMTKQEIRIQVLAKARIAKGDTIIDIGAGTGSLSIEAALQSQTGAVFAIERETEGIELIKANAQRFGTPAVSAILGSAPEAMAALPQADVILIGGSGGKLSAILAEADRLLKVGGRLVITAITVETLHGALQELKKRNYPSEACGIQVSRIRSVGASHMFQALNPIYIISATKEEG
ncbi:precorrin-6Y C5,15-methyltransferase (decarboxylating) subunit CbiT [Anaerospora sp.]|jgi:precorrin-6Y C5,15-methyltransferase (decarboxylating) CbiT subunit|uniref:precorrin-6Y C5,15-methyltransferase (decarboxylating) subunit CbiT n=1 Tax=Anaerospora sp. TaxID=1960278 RepID=UPI002898ED6A|nr:precorrin-6Y C5,15-methyltransferase (decarboxylating) subunit CbiT [Anaerospora sp.]MDF2928455.1 cbiT [Anaerospora sp.]